MCSAVNAVDMSALESLEAIEHRLRDNGIRLHLSEVKGPVMDKLKHTDFLNHLSGEVYLSQHQAIRAIVETRNVRAAAPASNGSAEAAVA
jgi:SulP family sulfate permease